VPAGGSVAHSGDDGAEGQESWKVAGKKEAGNNYCNCADKRDVVAVRSLGGEASARCKAAAVA
jgi:hypothetical protein